MSPRRQTAGTMGIVAGVVTGLAGLAPQVSALYLGSFILPIVWLIWAGYALRGATP